MDYVLRAAIVVALWHQELTKKRLKAWIPSDLDTARGDFRQVMNGTSVPEGGRKYGDASVRQQFWQARQAARRGHLKPAWKDHIMAAVGRGAHHSLCPEVSLKPDANGIVGRLAMTPGPLSMAISDLFKLPSESSFEEHNPEIVAQVRRLLAGLDEHGKELAVAEHEPDLALRLPDEMVEVHEQVRRYWQHHEGSSRRGKPTLDELTAGRVSVPDRIDQGLRRVLAQGMGVLSGPSGVGKTVSTVAWVLREQIQPAVYLDLRPDLNAPVNRTVLRRSESALTELLEAGGIFVADNAHLLQSELLVDLWNTVTEIRERAGAGSFLLITRPLTSSRDWPKSLRTAVNQAVSFQPRWSDVALVFQRIRPELELDENRLRLLSEAFGGDLDHLAEVLAADPVSWPTVEAGFQARAEVLLKLDEVAPLRQLARLAVLSALEIPADSDLFDAPSGTWTLMRSRQVPIEVIPPSELRPVSGLRFEHPSGARRYLAALEDYLDEPLDDLALAELAPTIRARPHLLRPTLRATSAEDHPLRPAVLKLIHEAPDAILEVLAQSGLSDLVAIASRLEALGMPREQLDDLAFAAIRPGLSRVLRRGPMGDLAGGLERLARWVPQVRAVAHLALQHEEVLDALADEIDSRAIGSVLPLLHGLKKQRPEMLVRLLERMEARGSLATVAARMLSMSPANYQYLQSLLLLDDDAVDALLDAHEPTVLARCVRYPHELKHLARLCDKLARQSAPYVRAAGAGVVDRPDLLIGVSPEAPAELFFALREVDPELWREASAAVASHPGFGGWLARATDILIPRLLKSMEPDSVVQFFQSSSDVRFGSSQLGTITYWLHQQALEDVAREVVDRHLDDSSLEQRIVEVAGAGRFQAVYNLLRYADDEHRRELALAALRARLGGSPMPKQELSQLAHVLRLAPDTAASHRTVYELLSPVTAWRFVPDYRLSNCLYALAVAFGPRGADPLRSLRDAVRQLLRPRQPVRGKLPALNRLQLLGSALIVDWARPPVDLGRLVKGRHRMADMLEGQSLFHYVKHTVVWAGAREPRRTLDPTGLDLDAYEAAVRLAADSEGLHPETRARVLEALEILLVDLRSTS